MLRATRRWMLGLALIASATLLYPAGPSCAADDEEPQEAEWALRIVEKEHDRQTGELRLVLENTSYQHVTAFGVAVIYARSDGSDGTQIRSREMLPGEGLAPAAVYEMQFDLGVGDAGDDLSRFPALQAVVHYEILSDTTHHGNAAYIEDVFRSRAAYVEEVERSLARIQEMRGGITEKASLGHF